MPGQFHKLRWFYCGINPDRFRFVGCEYYGLVWGRYWPLLALVIDQSWYNPCTSISLCAGSLEVGVFIQHGKQRAVADTFEK